MPPVDPRVSAAADVKLMLDAVLFEQLVQILGSLDQESLIAAADRKQLHGAVDLVGAVETRGVPLHELLGRTEDRRTPDADVAKLVGMARDDSQRLTAAHRQA